MGAALRLNSSRRGTLHGLRSAQSDAGSADSVLACIRIKGACSAAQAASLWWLVRHMFHRKYLWWWRAQRNIILKTNKANSFLHVSPVWRQEDIPYFNQNQNLHQTFQKELASLFKAIKREQTPCIPPAVMTSSGYRRWWILITPGHSHVFIGIATWFGFILEPKWFKLCHDRRPHDQRLLPKAFQLFEYINHTTGGSDGQQDTQTVLNNGLTARAGGRISCSIDTKWIHLLSSLINLVPVWMDGWKGRSRKRGVGVIIRGRAQSTSDQMIVDVWRRFRLYIKSLLSIFLHSVVTFQPVELWRCLSPSSSSSSSNASDIEPSLFQVVTEAQTTSWRQWTRFHYTQNPTDCLFVV